MSDSVLLRFLDRGLINVGGDDAKLAKLQATSAELVAVLKRNPDKTPAFSLIAFDPDAPESDPVVVEALEVLKKQWPTYVNTFAGVPIGVLRPLLLDALVHGAHDDDRVAVAFAACARNVLPFMETGNEHSIWADVVREVEGDVDRRAEQEWATPASINVGELKVDNPAQIKISNSLAKVKREVVLDRIKAAINNGSNPYNQMANWSQLLASGLTDTLAETIEGAMEQSKVGPIDLSAPIQQITSAVSAHVSMVLKAVSSATAGLQRRTNLIWWKQALFSPSAQTSYRKFSRTESAALMALDLHQQIPIFSPASVSAFLEETVRSVQDSQSEDARSVKVLLEETSNSKSLTALRQEAAILYPAPTGRCALSALIAHPEKQALLDNRAFRDLIGVLPDTVLTDGQWATWIFRDLQAGRATKESPKKKPTKATA
jgi:hypothetical protein